LIRWKKEGNENMKKNQKRYVPALMAFSLACSVLSGCQSASQNQREETQEESVQVSDSMPAALAYLDYAQEEDGNILLSVSVLLVGDASFGPDFDVDAISFDGDLENATDIKLQEIDDENRLANIWIYIEQNDLDVEDLNLRTNVSVRADALQDASGNALQTDITLPARLLSEQIEKGADSSIYSVYPDENTLVFRLKGENSSGAEMIDAYEDAIMESESHEIERVVIDFSDCKSMRTNAAYVLTQLIETSEPNVYIINANETSDYFEILSAANNENISFVQGDASSLDLSSASAYSAIESAILDNDLSIQRYR
jgi:hypothetical protein